MSFGTDFLAAISEIIAKLGTELTCQGERSFG
jgi:hypothetical protein